MRFPVLFPVASFSSVSGKDGCNSVRSPLMTTSGSHSRYFNKAALEIGCLAIASYMKTRCLSLYRENNNGEERLISDMSCVLAFASTFVHSKRYLRTDVDANR